MIMINSFYFSTIKEIYMNIALKNIDSIILSTPVLVTASIGIGFSFLENTEIPVLNSIGWLGTRCCMVIMPLAGTPLLVWSLAKTIFAKTLSNLTCNKLECLKNFSDECDMNLKIFSIGVPSISIMMPHVPAMVKTAKTAYEYYERFANAYEQVKGVYDHAKSEFDKIVAHFKGEPIKSEKAVEVDDEGHELKTAEA